MELAAKETHSISNNNRDIKSAGVSFDYARNSKEWHAKEGVAAIIAQKFGKIDIVRKATYCRDCKKNKNLKMITQRQL